MRDVERAMENGEGERLKAGRERRVEGEKQRDGLIKAMEAKGEREAGREGSTPLGEVQTIRL